MEGVRPNVEASGDALCPEEMATGTVEGPPQVASETGATKETAAAAVANEDVVAKVTLEAEGAVETAVRRGTPNDSPVGGRLARFAVAWEGAPRWARSIVQGGLAWNFKEKPPRSWPTVEPHASLFPELEAMLVKEVIEPCRRPKFGAKLFPVPKPDGSIRMIIDLSELNRYIVVRTFRFPSIKDLRKELHQGYFMAKLDLKDAYWHVPIARKFRSFLAFKWRKRFWRFKVMPFGLSVAPVAFQALMNFPRKQLLSRGVNLLAYLDDLVIWAPSLDLCSQAVRLTVGLLDRLGFLINWKKSQLDPTREMVWLGVRWNSQRVVMSLPEEAAVRLAGAVGRFRASQRSTRRMLESLLGSMAFVGQWLPEARLHKNLCLPYLANFPLDRKIRVCPPGDLLNELVWWQRPGNATQEVALHPPEPVVWFWADASDVGWGAHLADGRWAAGKWSGIDQDLHINRKEIRAVLWGLQELTPVPKSRLVLEIREFKNCSYQCIP